MRGRLAPVFLLFAMLFAGPVRAQDFGAEQPITRFAFGSCNHQWASQAHWRTIQSLDPQMWVWGGDVIYADMMPDWARQEQYNWLKHNEDYAAFAQGRFVTGTWDDHDFGYNNVGGDYSGKEASQRMFLSFLDEPEDSPRWQHPGVYGSWLIGPEGNRVKVILLDLRYFRQDPGETSELLGNTQWEWLTGELFADDAQLTFIMSSSQVLADEHNGDTWAQYPMERARLFGLLAASPAKTILLSGDRHFAEISRAALPDGRSLYDFTASGLTHVSPLRQSANRFRRGPAYTEYNFGFVTIDWGGPWGEPIVKLQIRSATTGEVGFEETVEWR